MEGNRFAFSYDNQIIEKLTDTDFYKFTMSYFIWKYYRNVKVRLSFKNRTESVRLVDEIPIDALHEQLDAVSELQFSVTELAHIGGTFAYGKPMFDQEWIGSLQDMGDLPMCEVSKTSDGQYRIVVEDYWWRVTLWETYILSIVNELRTVGMLSEMTRMQQLRVVGEGIIRLADKIDFLREHLQIVFSEFGTRRRAFREWQYFVNGMLADSFRSSSREPVQFRGTSNVLFAHDHELVPMGTSAHELMMVVASLYDEHPDGIAQAQNEVWSRWYETFGDPLSIFLPDTFGTAYSLRTCSRGLLNWRGSRQDSGDPYRYGEKLIQWYQDHNVNPTEKMIIFSDGLNVKEMHKIQSHFAGRIQVSFGWGTNATNDVGISPVSIVVKPSWAMDTKINRGKFLVKLSDNLAKASGRKEDVERYVAAVKYDETFFQPCTY